MAPQVFTRVMAPVSFILHSLGARILCCLDDWIILASSLSEALWARDTLLDLWHQLGIVINLAKSHLSLSQSATYLGMVIGFDFEGFSNFGEGFSPSLANKRIFVLQQAIHCFVDEPVEPPLIPLPSCSWGSHQGEVLSTGSASLMGFSG